MNIYGKAMEQSKRDAHHKVVRQAFAFRIREDNVSKTKPLTTVL